MSSSSSLGSRGEVVEAEKSSSETSQLEDKVRLEALTMEKDFPVPFLEGMGIWECKRVLVLPWLKVKLSGVHVEAAP